MRDLRSTDLLYTSASNKGIGMFGHNTLLELTRGLQHVPGAEKQWDTSVSSAAIKAGICACLHCAKKETVSILQNAECFPAYRLPAGLSGQGCGHAYRHFYFPCHVFILHSARFSWESLICRIKILLKPYGSVLKVSSQEPKDTYPTKIMSHSFNKSL